jgi:hypothetical protein
LASRTFTIDKLDDHEGLLTHEPAPREATLYRTEDFNGEFAEQCGAFHAARTITIVITTGNWNSRDHISVEGFYGEKAGGMPSAQVEDFQLPDQVGDQPVVLRGKLPFMFPPGVIVTVPAQPRGKATFSVGVGDVVAPAGTAFEDARATAEGALGFRYPGGYDDVVWMSRGERIGIPVVAVVAEPAAQGVTLYFR